MDTCAMLTLFHGRAWNGHSMPDLRFSWFSYAGKQRITTAPKGDLTAGQGCGAIAPPRACQIRMSITPGQLSTLTKLALAGWLRLDV